MMRLRATHFSLAVLALALAACSGAPEDSGAMSKVARAATRAIVDVVMEVDPGNAEDTRNGDRVEPLRLAATRPDAIIEPASKVTAELAASDERVPDIRGHVVTSTVRFDFGKICRDAGSLETLSDARPRGVDSTVACPLARVRHGNLTRI